MKKVFALALTACLCLVLAACSSGSGSSPKQENNTSRSTTEESSSAQTKNPEIAESGWAVGKSGYVHYGIGITNPNTEKPAAFPEITVTGKDAEGKILFSDKQSLRIIRPNETVYYGGQAGNGTAPATVEFSVALGKNNDLLTKKLPSGELFTLSNPNEVDSGYGMIHYTGELTLNQEVDATMIDVTTILRDASGSIVGGYSTFVKVNSDPAGTTLPFDVSAYDVPAHASYENYAMVWL